MAICVPQLAQNFISGVMGQIMQGYAVREMMEGCRQLKKVFKILCDRDAVRNTFPKISNDFKETMALLNSLDGVNATLSQVEAALAQRGYTFRSLAQEVSDTVLRVG